VHIANADAQTVSNTVQHILPNPLLLLQMVKKQQILLFLKCFQIYLALSSTARVMKKSNTLFNERRENLFFLNIPTFSVNVQGKSRSISVLQKNLVTIIQNISES
jgi:hypothetical protein